MNQTPGGAGATTNPFLIKPSGNSPPTFNMGTQPGGGGGFTLGNNNKKP